MMPHKVSDTAWAYCLGEMNEADAADFATRIAAEPALARDVADCEALLHKLGGWQNEPMPPWDPRHMVNRQSHHWGLQWLTAAFAAAALVFSLLPHFHASATGIQFTWSGAGISAAQMESRLLQFDSRNKLAVERRIAELREDQTLKNRRLVVSLLTVAEQRRRNDLIQMASWFSQQKELSNRQQRQIVQWVADAQQHDDARINALWTTVSNREESVP